MDEIGCRHIQKYLLQAHTTWSDLESIEQILAEILSRLPVRTLGICKSVSKRWNGLISSPHFVELQLRWSRRNLKYIIYPYDEYSDILKNVFLVEGNGEIGQIVSLPGFEYVCSPSMICTFDGLICCTNEILDAIDLDIRFCNPCTQELLVLPRGSPSSRMPSVGVAFDPNGKIYKVFRWFCGISESRSECKCEVYSSDTGLWKSIDRFAKCPSGFNECSFNPDSLSVSGRMHWFVRSEDGSRIPRSIVSVNIEETFTTISLPIELTPWSFLIDLNGRLSLVSVDENYIVDVWVLQDCNKSLWSWKASAKIEMENIDRFDTVVAHNNEIFFIIKDSEILSHFRIFNLVNKTWRVLDYADTFVECNPVAFPFSESLFPCCGNLGL